MAVERIDDLKELVWERMGYRKHFAGREAMGDLVEVAVQEWPTAEMPHIASGTAAEIYRMDQLAASIKRHITLTHGHDKRFGFIWTIVLSALISEMIRLLLAWWWNSQTNRDRMTKWQERWKNG